MKLSLDSEHKALVINNALGLAALIVVGIFFSPMLVADVVQDPSMLALIFAGITYFVFGLLFRESKRPWILSSASLVLVLVCTATLAAFGRMDFFLVYLVSFANYSFSAPVQAMLERPEGGLMGDIGFCVGFFAPLVFLYAGSATKKRMKNWAK